MACGQEAIANGLAGNYEAGLEELELGGQLGGGACLCRKQFEGACSPWFYAAPVGRLVNIVILQRRCLPRPSIASPTSLQRTFGTFHLRSSPQLGLQR